jgi:hypothetical protein
MKNEYFVIDVLFLRKKNPLKQEGKYSHLFSLTLHFVVT